MVGAFARDLASELDLRLRGADAEEEAEDEGGGFGGSGPGPATADLVVEGNLVTFVPQPGLPE